VFLFGAGVCGILNIMQNLDKLIREKIEWCRSWIPDSNVTRLDRPRVLLVGDSIVMGYGPKVAELMGGAASVAWVGTSRFLADPVYSEEIGTILRHTRFDIIHFNNGLHGFGYAEGVYEEYLRLVLDGFRAATPDAQWAVATSTPLRNKLDVMLWDERNDRVQVRNRTMVNYAEDNALPVTALYDLLAPLPEMYAPDGTHYTESGQALQAEAVVQTLRRLLARDRLESNAVAGVE
jgi:hypothetical protein